MNNMKVKFKSRLLISFLLVSLVFSGCQNLSEISDKYSTSSAGYESSVQDDSSEVILKIMHCLARVGLHIPRIMVSRTE